MTTSNVFGMTTLILMILGVCLLPRALRTRRTWGRVLGLLRRRMRNRSESQAASPGSVERARLKSEIRLWRQKMSRPSHLRHITLAEAQEAAAN